MFVGQKMTYGFDTTEDGFEYHIGVNHIGKCIFIYCPKFNSVPPRERKANVCLWTVSALKLKRRQTAPSRNCTSITHTKSRRGVGGVEVHSCAHTVLQHSLTLEPNDDAMFVP